MKLTWHIVRKDFRRLWPWLALLVGAMLARYVNLYVPGFVPEQNDLIALWRRAEIINDILLGLSLFATALAAATLVHEDAVIGDRTFWLTRPISGARLLAAKTLTFTLALLLLPLALQLGWWLFNHYSPADIAAQFPPLFARHAATAFAAFVCALLTRNLGSFLLAAIIGTLAVVYAHVLVNELLKLPSRTDDFNRERVELIAVLLALPACILHQYLTRRTRRTVALFGGTLILGLGIHAAWPWSVFKKPSRFGELPSLAADPGTSASASVPVPAFQPQQIWTSNSSTPQTQNVPAFAFDLTFSPISSGHAVEILAAEFPRNTPVFVAHNQRVTLPRPAFSAEYSLTDRLLILGKKKQAEDGSTSQTGGRVPEISAPVVNTLTLALRKPETIARLPAIPDTSGSLGPRQVRIAAVINLHGQSTTTRALPKGVKITHRTDSTQAKTALILDETLPTFLLSAEKNYPESDTDSFYVTGPDSLYLGEGHSRHAYFLVSRSDGTILRADNVLIHASLSVDGVRRRLVRAEFFLPLHDADLADYDLVKVVAPLVGTFTRTITFPPTRWTDPASP